jgi:Flp pilus assembly pilin Flp
MFLKVRIAMSTLEKAKRFFQRFKAAQRGATAVIFGVMIIPVIAISGGVVDYGRAVKTKSQLMATLDAAVLAATLQYSQDETTDYKQVVMDFVKKNLADADKTYQGLEVTIDVQDIAEDGELKAGLITKVETLFLGLVGFDEFDIEIQSAAMVGGNSLEVALVLDNTYSMSENDKIGDLKNAAKDLIVTLIPDGDDDKIRIALVPFADMVNLGTENRFEPGLDIPDKYVVSKDPWCDMRATIKTNCKTKKHEYECDKDGIPSICYWTEYYDCDVIPNPNFGVCYGNDRTYDWYGCMGSRKHDLNVRDDGYGTGVPGIMSTWNQCSKISPITRLTSSKETITADIDKMKAKQMATYIPSGLAWGWRMLSKIAPFTDAVPDDDESVKKVIVLMTDGANTRSPQKWSGDSTKNHSGEVYGHNKGPSAADTMIANTLTSELCVNIKAKNIMVFTIAFDVDEGSEIETLMKTCAGNGGKFFDADDGEALSQAFKEIGLSLLNLRLSQ